MTWWQTYSELFPEEFMCHLLLLIGCPAAEAWKELLPVIFVFGLGDINKIQQKHCIATVWSSQTFARTPVDFPTESKLNSSQLSASPVWRQRPFWPSAWCWRSRGGNAYSWREGMVLNDKKQLSSSIKDVSPPRILKLVDRVVWIFLGGPQTQHSMILICRSLSTFAAAVHHLGRMIWIKYRQH